MTTTLVTGGAGFIGSHIVHALVARGETVRVLDDLSTGKLANLGAVRSQVTFLEGSICDPHDVREALRGADFVFHQAAVASVPLSIEQPLHVERVNVEGTLTLLDAAAAADVRRVVFAASCAAYGDATGLPSREEQPIRPISPYAITKVAGELYARVYTELKGLPMVALRYFNVFGPRQDPRGPYAAVVPRFTEAVLAGERPTIFGTGEQTRDFVFVRNVVHANLLAREAAAAPGHVYNVGSGVGTSLLDLVRALERVTGRTIAPTFAPARGGDILHSRADISRARRDLGYEPLVCFQDGLAETVAAYAPPPTGAAGSRKD
jgi:UDP-glucose 4-epimerase